MFTPPTEGELKTFSQDYYDNDIQLNNNNNGSSIELSNVVNSKYFNFQINQNENNLSNHYCKNEIIKNDNKFFSDSKKEANRSSSFVNIETGRMVPTEENIDNNTELNFWNFRSLFQTKKVSFPLQKGKESKDYNN